MSSSLTADPPIREILLQVAEAEGPVRLFKPRADPAGEGILPVSRGPAVRIVIELLGTCLQELPRASRQPRRLQLSNLGVRTLVASTPAVHRPALIRRASPFYRDRLFRAWKELASPAEQRSFQDCFSELYGDLLPSHGEAAIPPDGFSFLRAMAKELVLSWERVLEPEARRALVRAMLSLGLREIGQAGQRVPFTGRLHSSEEPLFQGDPVEITEPGWTVTDQQGEFLVRKAHVKPVPSSHA